MREPHLVPSAISGCLGKERYDSGSVAERVAHRRTTSKKMMHKGRAKPLQHYRCAHCGFWHIGTAIGR